MRRLIAALTMAMTSTLLHVSVAAAQTTDTVAPVVGAADAMAPPLPVGIWSQPGADIAPSPSSTTTSTTTVPDVPDVRVGPAEPLPSPPRVNVPAVPEPATTPLAATAAPPSTTAPTTTAPPTTEPTRTTLGQRPFRPHGEGVESGGEPRRPDAPSATEPLTAEPDDPTTTTEPFSMAPNPTTGPPSPPADVAARALPDPVTSPLPYTGADPGPVLALAFGLVAGGCLLVWGVRRRPRHARGS